MGRYQAVDRDSVLDAAELIVRTRGIAALTIDAVAKAAGISKGGVQSSFGTKDQLIAAMYARWGTEFEAAIARQAGEEPSPMARLRAYIEVTYRTDKAEGDRAAGMMAALLNAPEHLRQFQQWYASQLDGIDMSTPEGRRARLAFLANEGLFMLRSFGFMKMSEREWREIYADIRGLLDDAEGRKT
ncbi:TetR/AcrR family transcriptional regulator [Archangium minus]|uniref:TetR/AcrR family transcriptional regulator n=1 Tax=Archangium minus TaxID=83450 RepID=A0ABY9X917_9BACT|nr:TetR/AcrR family transcriptional regulator [Archangium violaceum]WNG51878.1 TetR/AcrR family transcriptional regulator [Archangium minus]